MRNGEDANVGIMSPRPSLQEAREVAERLILKKKHLKTNVFETHHTRERVRHGGQRVGGRELGGLAGPCRHLVRSRHGSRVVVGLVRAVAGRRMGRLRRRENEAEVCQMAMGGHCEI